MIRFNWMIINPLLLLLHELEARIMELEKVGVTVLPLEQHRDELILLILGLCGIKRDDDAVDCLCEKIFEYLADEISIKTCMETLDSRLNAIKKERENASGQDNCRRQDDIQETDQPNQSAG